MPPETNLSHRSWNAAFRELRPTTLPTPSLTERVAALALAADAGRAAAEARRRQTRRLSAGALAALAVGMTLIAVSVLAPRIALARMVRAVTFNLSQIRGYHYKVTIIHRGNTIMSMESWSRDGKVREDDQILGGQNHTTVENQRTTKDSKGPADTDTIRLSLPEMQKSLRDSSATNIGDVTVAGRVLERIAVQGKVKPFPSIHSVAMEGRSVYWIDRQTMLPTAMEQQIDENGVWRPTVRIDLDFAHPVPLSIFRVASTHSPTSKELRAIGMKAGRRFANPIARMTLAKQTIALRDVQVNPDGDVFFLYTDDSTRAKASNGIFLWEITDDLGTVYARTGLALTPFLNCTPKSDSRGILVGTQAMQGTVMVPIVAPQRTHPVPHAIHVVFRYIGSPKLAYAQCTVPVRRTAGLLPDYSSDLKALELPGSKPSDYKSERASSRDLYFQEKRDWRGMLAATDDALRDGVTELNIYLDRATACEALGQWDAARHALTDARTHDRTGLGEEMIRRAESEWQAARKRSVQNPT